MPERRLFQTVVSVFALFAILPWLAGGLLIVCVTVIVLEGGKQPAPLSVIAFFLLCDLAWVAITVGVPVMLLRRRRVRQVGDQ